MRQCAEQRAARAAALQPCLARGRQLNFRIPCFQSFSCFLFSAQLEPLGI